MPKVTPKISDEQLLKEFSTLDGEILLLPAQVAKILAISVETLKSNRSDGAPPRFVKVGGSYHYRVADVLAYLKANPVFNNGMEVVRWEIHADELRFCGLDPLELQSLVRMPMLPKTKSKKLFFDVMPTSFDDAGAKIVSIGFVSEKNGQEFYAELTGTYTTSDCSDFVKESVLPLLEGGAARMTEFELRCKLADWIDSLKSDHVLVSDFPPIDWPFIYDMNHGCRWPDRLQKYCEASYFLIPKDATKFNQALREFWLQNASRRHHALVGARSLYQAWLARK